MVDRHPHPLQRLPEVNAVGGGGVTFQHVIVDHLAGRQAAAGAGAVGAESRPVRTGQLAGFGPGDTITVSGAVRQESRNPALDVVVLGGAPIREPVAWSGPFVMNTRAEVRQAFEDYQAGRLGSIPAGAEGSPGRV